MLVIAVRGDGHFPFPKTWPEGRLQLIVLAHTIALVAGIVWTAHLVLRDRMFLGACLSRRMHDVLYTVGPPACVAAILGLHVLQADYYHRFGYRKDVASFVTIAGLALIPLALYWSRAWASGKRPLHPFLLSVLAGSLVLKAIPLRYFPVTSIRSDLLPMLREGALSLLRGENPYRAYLLDNGVMTPLVRLPGLLLAFAPAAALGIDLRLVTLLFETAAFLLLFALVVDRGLAGVPSSQALWPIAFFVLLPYWHYRHELYETPFWLLLLATLLALDHAPALVVALGTGLLAATHQWGWLFAPYLVVAVLKRKGWRQAGAVAGAAGLVALVVVELTVHGSPKAFFENVLGTYDRMTEQSYFYSMSMYFSPIFGRLGAASLLRPIQALLQLPLLALALRYGDRTDKLAAILALSLTATLLFNQVCWTYQYLLVLFLLFSAVVLRCASLGSRAPDAPAPSSR